MEQMNYEILVSLQKMYKEGLITLQEYASHVKTLKNFEPVVEKELTDEEKWQIQHDATVKKANESAELNRQRIAEIEEAHKKAYEEKKHKEEMENAQKLADMDIKFKEDFLRKLTNKNGERIYSDESIAEMSYAELGDLYEYITSKMSFEQFDKINSNKIVEDTKKSVELDTLLTESIEKMEQNKTKVVDFVESDELAGETMVNEDLQDEKEIDDSNALFEAPAPDALLDKEEVKEENPSYSVPTEEEPVVLTENDLPEEISKDEDEKTKAPIGFDDESLSDAYEIVNEKAVEKTNDLKSPEPSRTVTPVEVPEERLNKLKLSKNSVKSFILKGLLIGATLVAVGPYAGIAGVAGYNLLARKVKNGTFIADNPNKAALQYNIEKIMNIGKNEKGGKVK